MKDTKVTEERTEEPQRFFRDKIWWFYMVLAVISGTIVVDHLLPVSTQRLAILDEHNYQERMGSGHTGWSQRRSEAINSTMLRLSDGTVLQLTSLGDVFISGDTLEIQRTPLLGGVLQYRKATGRARNWLLVDSNKLDYRIYPYIVFACSFLLLFPWRWENWRWSLQAGLALMLVCWLFMLIGTGGLARLTQWF